MGFRLFRSTGGREKGLIEVIERARDAGLYNAITDCGAGGFSSAVGEMGEECGADVDMARVPLKYHGLASHEIWISEAQERMVLSVPPEHVDEVLAVFAAEDVEATVIGTFTGDGVLVVHEGELVEDLPTDGLDGLSAPPAKALWEATARVSGGVL